MPATFAISLLPASWLHGIECLTRSSFSQVALGARHGASLGLRPHARYSVPARQLAGPLSLVDACRVGTHHLASSGFQPTGRHFLPPRWRALSSQRTRVASAPRGLRSSTRTSRTPLPASSTTRWRTLVPTTLYRHLPLGLQRDGRHCSPVCQPTGSLPRQRALHYRVTGIEPCMPLKPRPLVLNHTRITAYWYLTIRKCSCLIDSLICHGSLLLPCGASVCVAGSFFPGTQLNRPHSARAGRPSGAFAHILTPAMYITRSELPTSHRCDRTSG